MNVVIDLYCFVLYEGGVLEYLRGFSLRMQVLGDVTSCRCVVWSWRFA